MIITIIIIIMIINVFLVAIAIYLIQYIISYFTEANIQEQPDIAVSSATKKLHSIGWAKIFIR